MIFLRFSALGGMPRRLREKGKIRMKQEPGVTQMIKKDTADIHLIAVYQEYLGKLLKPRF